MIFCIQDSYDTARTHGLNLELITADVWFDANEIHSYHIQYYMIFCIQDSYDTARTHGLNLELIKDTPYELMV